ncbi:HTH domain-containing protein [Tepidanaerobacter sp. GT38]|uniref:BglG family transcription antiterminator n=1 Tax=Tepidanaerobacter sp. GT38 TaxID=2722793 RepID=UPI001F1CE0DF|nr:HTH domain-containing protein [Tepidanaerobacter sp. GT38]MCG1012903.1 HTH domain-containing protein [Tepidanaerobacter sp. GT38]
MVYLNPRQKTILRYLAAKKDWVKSHEMAVILGVSDRTVRNDIAYINSLVEGEENVIISHRKGYRINDDDKARKMLVEDNSDIPNDPDERANFLLKKLVFEKRGLNIYQLAEEIMVSESTIASDLKRLNKILKEYGRDLSVVRKSDEIFLEGSEKEKRSLLSELLFNETNHSYFNLTKYKRYFKDIDLITIQKYLIETVKKYDFLLNEVALVNLLVHIAITVERIKNKNFLLNCNIKCDTFFWKPE